MSEDERTKGNGSDPPVKLQNEEKKIHLRWRDYLALFLALLETLALPLVILIVTIVGMVFIFSLLR